MQLHISSVTTQPACCQVAVALSVPNYKTHARRRWGSKGESDVLPTQLSEAPHSAVMSIFCALVRMHGGDSGWVAEGENGWVELVSFSARRNAEAVTRLPRPPIPGRPVGPLPALPFALIERLVLSVMGSRVLCSFVRSFGCTVLCTVMEHDLVETKEYMLLLHKREELQCSMTSCVRTTM
jgi:hypothetical protein